MTTTIIKGIKSEKKKSYSELIHEQPKLQDCFFAFSNKQFEEGLDKVNLRGKKIYDGGLRLYGTKEGIQKYIDFNRNITKRIKEYCTPQEVYDYEFTNHECDYVGNDEEAIKLVITYFGEEKAKGVKRKWGYYEF